MKKGQQEHSQVIHSEGEKLAARALTEAAHTMGEGGPCITLRYLQVNPILRTRH